MQLYTENYTLCALYVNLDIILKSDIRGSNSFSKQKSTYFNVMWEVQGSNKAVPGTHCIWLLVGFNHEEFIIYLSLFRQTDGLRKFWPWHFLMFSKRNILLLKKVILNCIPLFQVQKHQKAIVFSIKFSSEASLTFFQTQYNLRKNFRLITWLITLCLVWYKFSY